MPKLYRDWVRRVELPALPDAQRNAPLGMGLTFALTGPRTLLVMPLRPVCHCFRAAWSVETNESILPLRSASKKLL